MKALYPCIITWNADDDVYYVKFPDMENVFTDGADLYEAVEMAEDALNLMMLHYESDTGKKPPIPSTIRSLRLGENDTATLIRVDTESYSAMLQRLREEKIYRDPDAKAHRAEFERKYGKEQAPAI